MFLNINRFKFLIQILGLLLLLGSAGFAQETGVKVFIFGGFRVRDFDGDAAAQVGVFGGINNAHSALTELTQNSVMRDCLPDHE